MKEKEILAMEAGSKLDTLVAEHVFQEEIEWDYMPCGKSKEQFPFLKGKPHTPEFGELRGKVAINIVPSYSTDIECAWEVVEKMKEEYGDFILDYDAGYDGGKWAASVDKLRAAALAKTAEEAICKAALIAKYSDRKT